MRWKILSLFLFCIACFATSFAAAGNAVPAPGKYVVVADQSLVRVQVFRDGILKTAGHNHVIGLRALQGRITVGATLDDSSLALQFSAADLSVDLPEDRASGGEPFVLPVDEEDRQGTRNNMLGPRLLNAALYPTVYIQSARLRGDFAKFNVEAQISLAGRENRILIPVELRYENEQLRASGKFILRHEQLGLVPFAVLFGALAVKDEIRIEFEILAEQIAAVAAISPR